MESDNKLRYISGPTCWFVFQYHGRDFHFFGDKHGSCDGDYVETGKPFSRITPGGLKFETPQAKDIAYLLYDLFEQNKDRRYIDFFLEIPFVRKNLPSPELAITARTFYHTGNRSADLRMIIDTLPPGFLSTEQICRLHTRSSLQSTIDSLREKIQRDVFESGYIERVLYTFANCFTVNPKLPANPYHLCTRFHRADIRRSPSQVRGACLAEYLYSKMCRLLKVLASNPTGESKTHFIQVLDNFHILMNNCLSTEKGGRMRKLFDLHLQSNDFRNEMIRVLSTLGLTKKELAEFSAGMIMNFSEKDGRVRHKIKKQLDNLRAEGSSTVAELIERFCQDKYSQRSGDLHLLMWNLLYESHVIPWKTHDEVGLIPIPNIPEVIPVNEALLMDAYVLARMFRKLGPESKVSDLVVTYTGSQHSKNYHDFFTQYLGVKCLDKAGYFQEEDGYQRYLESANFSQYF